MKVERFEQGTGVPIEEFLDIITNGFYYIGECTFGGKTKKEVYWMGNQSVFIGNGYCPHSNNIVEVLPLFKADDEKVEDGHYWDWKNKCRIFNFENYNKTWSAKREVLEEIINKENLV